MAKFQSNQLKKVNVRKILININLNNSLAENLRFKVLILTDKIGQGCLMRGHVQVQVFTVPLEVKKKEITEEVGSLNFCLIVCV